MDSVHVYQITRPSVIATDGYSLKICIYRTIKPLRPVLVIVVYRACRVQLGKSASCVNTEFVQSLHNKQESLVVAIFCPYEKRWCFVRTKNSQPNYLRILPGGACSTCDDLDVASCRCRNDTEVYVPPATVSDYLYMCGCPGVSKGFMATGAKSADTRTGFEQY